MDELVKEALIADVKYCELWDYTWGELIEIVNAHTEKIRRKNKEKSTIAYLQAQLIATWMWSSKNIDITDVFPYWTDEEKKEIQVNKYKKIMYKYASQTSMKGISHDSR